MVKIKIVIMFVSLLLTGCATNKTCSPVSHGDFRINAVHAVTKITVDGKLDEPVWKHAQVYPLYLCGEMPNSPKMLQEGGEIYFAWDEQFIYMAARLRDSDIVAKGLQDNLPHFTLGDVCEFFIKLEGEPFYWELYVTPRGNKTAYFLEYRRAEPKVLEKFGLKAAAQITGSINDQNDIDTGWFAEIAVPIKDISSGPKPYSGKWKILVARYNYSKYLQGTDLEYSAASRLSAIDFHLLDEYAFLCLDK